MLVFALMHAVVYHAFAWECELCSCHAIRDSGEVDGDGRTILSQVQTIWLNYRGSEVVYRTLGPGEQYR